MYCSKCGKKHSDGSNFCVHCGVEIKVNEKEALVDKFMKKTSDSKEAGFASLKTAGNNLHSSSLSKNNKKQPEINEEMKKTEELKVPLNVDNKQADDLEKVKKKVMRAGTSILALGWISLIIITGFLGFFIYQTGVSNVEVLFVWIGSWLFSLPFILAFIILGHRINILLDKHLFKYLVTILILSIVSMLISFAADGSIGGILLLLVVFYTISALLEVKKLLSDKKYQEEVKNPKYKFTWAWFWGVLILFFLIVGGGFYYMSELYVPKTINNKTIDNNKIITSEKINKVVVKEKLPAKDIDGERSIFYEGINGYLVYDHEDFDFYYPDDWFLETGADGTEVSVLSELEGETDIFAENCNLVVDSVMPDYSLEEYYSLSVEQLPNYVSDFKMIEEGSIKLANTDALYLAYNGTLSLGDFFEDSSDEEYKLSWLQYIAKPNDDVYIITCTAEAETFDSYVNQFDLIASYFLIK